MLELTDTHCHIQSAGQTKRGETITKGMWAKQPMVTAQGMVEAAAQDDVTRLICVGCTLEDSQLAVDFVIDQPSCWASIGIHPHEAKTYIDQPELQQKFSNLVKAPKVVAIGECGLDYHYNHSPKNDQLAILRFQLELASKNNLPLIFHVRDAFDDFWTLFDQYKGLKGVIHSFTANQAILDQILRRGLYVGLNGITTFAKDPAQLAAVKAVPLPKMLLETDSPFLTPVPFRGRICEPKHTKVTAEFLANLRGESLAELAQVTTANARALFKLD